MKLEGIRVADLSRFLPGPVLTQFMADHGAEVIKVESVDEGEPTRAVGGLRDGVSVFFANTQRGKKSLALDLKHADGKEALLRLAATADVLVEAFRPGVADRLGVGYPAVAKRAPHIVYLSISAFGANGRYRDVASHDLAIEAMAGVLSLTQGQDGKPAIPGLAAGDMLSATIGLSAVLMALLRRKDTGRGDHVDLAMADCLLAGLPNQFDTAMIDRRQPKVGETRSLGGNALYRLYETSDGQWIALGGQELKFAMNLLNALGRPDLIEISKLPPGPPQHPLRDFLMDAFRRRTRSEWVDWARHLDIPFAPVQSLPDVLDDPHFRERGTVTTDTRGWDHIGTPIRFAEEPGCPSFAPPALGEHSIALLGDLGYGADEIERLVRQGVVRQASSDEIAAHVGLRGAAGT
jgi:crotonobetainyl-CoA:carnitine CoA-transferase CaiB-like acyl-CoA transferase